MEVEPTPGSIPAGEPSRSPSAFVENGGGGGGGDDAQHASNNKRKADEANLDASPAPAPVPAPARTPSPTPVPSTTPTATATAAAISPHTANGNGTVTPPPTPPTTTPTIPTTTTATTIPARQGQGSCRETAIALDSSSSSGSSDEEDETDVPVGNMASPSPSPRVSIKLSSAAVLAAAAAPRGVGRIPGGAAAVAAAAAAAGGARGAGGSISNGWGHGAEAAGGGYGNGCQRATNGYGNGVASAGKYANGNGAGAAASASGFGSSSSSPSSSPSGHKKKAAAGYQRKLGRPVGSKSRYDDVDAPYVGPSSPQRMGAGYAPNAADRPRRQPGPRKRWADEMMNPGEQWLRKTPKAPQALPPNPVDASIPDAPTFYPTPEQFRDPLSYIESIRPMAESYGIAKIVPPKGWNPPPTPMNLHARKRVPTKKQALHSLMNSDEVYDDGRNFTIVDYKIMADRFSEYWRNRGDPELKPRKAPPVEPQTPKVETPPGATEAEFHEAARENVRLRRLEREYWNVVDGGVEEAEVEYANDLSISDFWSGFPMPPNNFMDGSSYDRAAPCRFDDPEYYKTCGWNLNNLPFWPGSVLRFFRTHINGLTAPWLYLGMQFATFAWHNEDNYLYSLNYHHSGAAKQWYGIPGKHAMGFEACLAKELGETLDTVSEHLYRITKMLSPVYLQQANVPVCRLQQLPGQFVVTFPKAYHGGFSYGFNCGEAVNFAVPDWISYSRESTEAYRSASRMAALSHDKMVATLTMYLPDHDVKGCELVVRELKRIHKEELDHRVSLELKGVQDPARQGVPLPRFRLGLIEKDTEEYDERRVCKTCKHTLFMTGVACPCSDVDVSCLRCVREACSCPVSNKYLLSWWREDDLSRFVRTAETYLRKLRDGQADEAAVASFRANINPF